MFSNASGGTDAPSPSLKLVVVPERARAPRHDRRRHCGLAAAGEGHGRLATTSASSTRAPACSPAYGAEYIEGLKLGLQYATNGTNKVNGKTINLTLVDDGTDPTKAVSAAKDLIGQGYKIIAGTVSSGVALQLAPLADQNHVLYISGPAARDAITGRQQVHVPLRPPDDPGRAHRRLVPDRRRTRRSSSSRRTRRSARATSPPSATYLGGKGHTVSSVLVPLTATDLTPFAQQAKQANADLVFVAWAGTTAGAMWKALDQQNVFAGTKVVTGLAERATWPTLRRPGDEDPVPLALRLHGAEEQGQRLARQADAQAQPGARPVHAGRIRRRRR